MHQSPGAYPRRILDPLFTVVGSGAKFLWDNKEQIPLWLTGGAWTYNTAKAVKEGQYIPDPNFWLRQQARWRSDSDRYNYRSPWAYRYGFRRYPYRNPYNKYIKRYRLRRTGRYLTLNPRRRYKYVRHRYNKIDRLADLIDTI